MQSELTGSRPVYGVAVFLLGRILKPLVGLSSMAAALASGLPVMPQPWKSTAAAGVLPIDAGFSIGIQGYSDRRMTAAVERLMIRLSGQTGIPMRAAAKDAKTAVLLLECEAAGPPYPALGEDESYRLEITPAKARLTAPATTGILRGLETFAQMVEPGQNGYSVAAFQIEDKPRFPWRGLMLDVARHWMPLPVIERNLNAMAAVKMNVFHWHLSDDQGIRVESRRFPKLQQLGSDGNFYTQKEIRHVVEYARERGIRVLPEFDVPGHTTAMLAAYPALGSAPGPYEIERTWGVFQPTLDPSRETTYTFLDGFIEEMASLFPDPYFHIGGDEIDETQWKASPAIQAFARRRGFSTSADLHAYFNRRVHSLVRKHGKIMVGWDEILHQGLGQEVVIQSWRGQESLASAASKGYRGILSFGYYLDHMKPASYHYGNDPGADPAGKILGGEACMWTEYVSPETVDSRIWPRAAAVAERLWSPAEVRDIPSMYERLALLSRSLEWTGVRHRANFGPMLDRLAGGSPVEPVRMVADAVEALGLDVRYKARHYTSQIPLNRLPDAARPESEKVQELERLAQAHPEAAELRITFTGWSRIRDLLGGLPPQDYLAAEVTTIAGDLTLLGSMGLQVLDRLESGNPVPENWIAEQRQILDRMEQPHAEVRLAAVRPVRVLLDIAGKGLRAKEIR